MNREVMSQQAGVLAVTVAAVFCPYGVLIQGVSLHTGIGFSLNGAFGAFHGGQPQVGGDHGINGWGRLPIRKGVFVDMVIQVKSSHIALPHIQAFNGARR